MTVRIDFRLTRPDGSCEFRDALVLPDDHGLSEAEILAMQQERYDAWYIAVTTPPPPPEEG